MPEVKRTVKLVTTQKITDASSTPPMREWTIEIWLVDQQGHLIPATLFEKATYRLHETFGDRAVQVFKKPPFKITESGWGEFDMRIGLATVEKGPEHSIPHDLHFQAEKYESAHTITFKNPKPNLLAALRESGPVPQDSGALKAAESAKKKKRPDKGVDMDLLATNLQLLSEDDLLAVVQMIHERKTAETVCKNDVEQGEFHVDLYTLPDSLITDLWSYTKEHLPNR